jgi:hypothetical protein
MSLSRFLRDYIYIPLGGGRNGWGKTGCSGGDAMEVGHPRCFQLHDDKTQR